MVIHHLLYPLGFTTALEPSTVSPLEGTSPKQPLDPSSLPECYNSNAIFGELSSADLQILQALENRARPISDLTSLDPSPSPLPLVTASPTLNHIDSCVNSSVSS